MARLRAAELIVKQTRGVYKVRNEGLEPLYLEAEAERTSEPFRVHEACQPQAE